MAKDFATMEDSNRSANPSIHEVSDPARRVVLRGGLGAALLGPLAGAGLASCALPGDAGPVAAAGPRIGFVAVAASAADRVTVPAGYSATVFMPWGEPVGVTGRMPAFRDDAGNSAAEQAVQMGMHHDGVHYFALDGSRRGLLVMNHEYSDDGLLHAGGMADWSAEKVAKSQAAHGVSVTEIAWRDARWQAVRPSPYARRFTGNTPFAVAGPAAGHPLMTTAADPSGRLVLGTLNNCASGMTPWGTYLSGEENFYTYFSTAQTPTPHERRWGLRRNGVGYRWHEHDERFDTVRHPNEPNRFGWVVEIDPFDPQSTPVKRTALGRAAHEGAWVALTRDGRAVVYSGEDARFEYLYKFVSRDPVRPGGARANATLLDHGTLHVARFAADGRGRWLPLVAGQGPLAAFADPGEVVIRSRQASDALGATRMDRPEWLAIDTASRWVYCTLTNNPSRGQPGFAGVDGANPRANNVMGSIIRWKEDGDFDGEAFEWNHLVLAGDPANERVEAKGNVRGDIFACPDGIAFDARGTLWVQTDMGPAAMNKGEMARLGNNQMLACDVTTGEMRRFLVGPVNCEITGATWTPDGRTMFVNVQHPGETPSERSDAAEPRRFSNWPDFRPEGRPRSATVVIRRSDGGLIGT
ncbi:MAG: PhoX family phosphatase [Caldimonas sp.]